MHIPGTLKNLVWPAAGIPKAIHVDNAQEFHGDAFTMACEDWGIAVQYRPFGGKPYGGHVERLIGATMRAVHVLTGNAQFSTLEKGDFDSEKDAALTLAEFEDWLDLEISANAPCGLGGNTAGGQVVDIDVYRTRYLPFGWRRLGRTGVTLFGVTNWSDVFA